MSIENQNYMKKFMQDQKLTKEAFANILGCTPGAVTHWLNGERSIPEVIMRLMLFFEDYGLDIRKFHA